MKRREFVSAVGAGLFGLSRPGQPGWMDGEAYVERRTWAMGQMVRLELFAASEQAGLDAAQAAFAELRRVESALSIFDDRSDLSELNRQAGVKRVRVGGDLLAVLRAGLRFELDSGGAFNPAIEPLMEAWGFRARRAKEPSAAEIVEARDAVRHAGIVMAGERVLLRGRETRLDLGGIGVGYGLDRAVGVLRRAGITRAFLDVSGDCYALGSPPGQQGWRVGVADPGRAGRIIASTRIRDESIATSSNLVSVIHYGRAVRGHVMDPATGWPAEALAQVTVVARTGIEADALSTAMLISGRPAAGVLRFYTA